MRKIFLIFAIFVFSYGESVFINDFQSDLYSKSGANNMKKITMNLEIDTRDDNVNKSAIYDALNIIVGSYYVEDIMTSLGKENFKATLMKYLSKKYSIDIDQIYILSLKIVNEVDIDKIIEAIRQKNLCNEDNNKENSKDYINKEFGKDYNEP